jgi:adenylate cyclase
MAAIEGLSVTVEDSFAPPIGLARFTVVSVSASQVHTLPMTIEIERKFVLRAIPGEDILGKGVALRQGYIAEEAQVSVRIRIAPNISLLTVKAGVGLTRTEVEVAISAQQAEALWPHTADRRIVKTRYRVPLSEPGKLVAEVDVYSDRLDGLCTVEVEFPSEQHAAAFDPPDWFGVEVTGDRAWTNAALARNGIPVSGEAHTGEGEHGRVD